MSKPQHVKKKANHGKRPANSKLRKTKRQQVKTWGRGFLVDLPPPVYEEIMPRRPLIVDPSLYDITKPIADLDEIRRYNPQRFEMEQLTGVLYEDLSIKAMVGYLGTSDQSFWVRGHCAL